MFIREWGEGPRIALLVHGLAASSLTWNALAIDLANQGYRVLAPDLYGHGLSKRLPRYSVQRWANAISSYVPEADLVIGHSIGALIASKLHTKLRPTRTVLIDPVFRLPMKGFVRVTQEAFMRTMLSSAKPKNKKLSELSREEISQWDPKTVQALKVNALEVKEFLKNAQETLIARCRGSYIAPLGLLSKNSIAKTITIPQAGHNIHHDNYPALKENIFNFLNVDIQPKMCV